MAKKAARKKGVEDAPKKSKRFIVRSNDTQKQDVEDIAGIIAKKFRIKYTSSDLVRQYVTQGLVGDRETYKAELQDLEKLRQTPPK